MDAAKLVELLTAEDLALINRISEPRAFVRAARTAFRWTLDEISVAVESGLDLEPGSSRRNVDNWAAGRGAHPARMRVLRDLIAAAENPFELACFMAVLKEHDDHPD